MTKLQNKIAVITGGTRGFGLETARLFAQNGAKVVIASRSEETVTSAVDKLRVEGLEVSGLSIDVGQMAQVEQLAAYAVEKYGGFDIWMNNAGTTPAYGPAAEIDAEAFETALKTNIFGTYYGSITAMRHFLYRNAGKLINILGDGAKRLTPMRTAYGSSKAWSRSFTLTLAKEYKDTNIGVYALQPGLMLTELVTQLAVVEGYEERLKVFPTVLRMLAKPPELPAHKALWLASSATDGKTGLEVSGTGRIAMMGGALVEGIRTLLKRPSPEIELDVTVVPSALEKKQ